MVKIHITGNSGSGKTTLGKQLERALGLSVYGLDKVVWQQGWVKTPEPIRVARENELISLPEWIIEGVSPRVRKAADIIIFLDISRWTSLRRSLMRSLKYLFTGRPELPEHCPEILFLHRQVGIVWKFKNHTRPGIMRDFEMHHGQVYVVRSKEDLEMALKELGYSHQARG